jgi:hypothetical protein
VEERAARVAASSAQEFTAQAERREEEAGRLGGEVTDREGRVGRERERLEGELAR